jgi:hypothetical protein
MSYDILNFKYLMVFFPNLILFTNFKYISKFIPILLFFIINLYLSNNLDFSDVTPSIILFFNLIITILPIHFISNYVLIDQNRLSYSIYFNNQHPPIIKRFQEASNLILVTSGCASISYFSYLRLENLTDFFIFLFYCFFQILYLIIYLMLLVKLFERTINFYYDKSNDKNPPTSGKLISVGIAGLLNGLLLIGGNLIVVSLSGQYRRLIFSIIQDVNIDFHISSSLYNKNIHENLLLSEMLSWILMLFTLLIAIPFLNRNLNYLRIHEINPSFQLLMKYKREIPHYNNVRLMVSLFKELGIHQIIVLTIIIVIPIWFTNISDLSSNYNSIILFFVYLVAIKLIGMAFYAKHQYLNETQLFWKTTLSTSSGLYILYLFISFSLFMWGNLTEALLFNSLLLLGFVISSVAALIIYYYKNLNVNVLLSRNDNVKREFMFTNYGMFAPYVFILANLSLEIVSISLVIIIGINSLIIKNTILKLSSHEFNQNSKNYKDTEHKSPIDLTVFNFVQIISKGEWLVDWINTSKSNSGFIILHQPLFNWKKKVIYDVSRLLAMNNKHMKKDELLERFNPQHFPEISNLKSIYFDWQFLIILLLEIVDILEPEFLYLQSEILDENDTLILKKIDQVLQRREKIQKRTILG